MFNFMFFSQVPMWERVRKRGIIQFLIFNFFSKQNNKKEKNDIVKFGVRPITVQIKNIKL